jgi:hypothetical protein
MKHRAVKAEVNDKRALIPGLAVKVQGRYNEESQVLADANRPEFLEAAPLQWRYLLDYTRPEACFLD